MNYYELLGISKNASAEEIRFAYRRRAKELHPDSGGSDEQMAELNKAKEVLLDPERRALYDEDGHVNDEVDVNPVEARNLLYAMFDAIMEDAPEDVNPVKTVREFLRQHVEAQLSLISEKMRKITRVNRFNNRVASKVENADNLFDHYSKKKISKLEEEITELQKIIDITELAKKMIENLYSKDLGYSAGPVTAGQKVLLSDAYREFFGLNN